MGASLTGFDASPNAEWELEVLVRVHTEAGRFEELAQLYADRAAAVDDPAERASLLLSLATLLRERFDDDEQALRVLLEALYARPSDDRVAALITVIAREKDLWTPVLDAVNAWVVRGHGDLVSLSLRAAEWYGALGHPEWGAAHVERARGLAPADVRVARAWLRLVETVGPIDAIEAARRRVLELDPTDEDALEGLARIHRGRGTLDAFIASLEAMVSGSASGRLNPVRLAIARLRGDDPRALVALEDAYAADRTDARVLRALDEAYERGGRYTELLRVLDARVLHDRDCDRTELALRAARVLEEQFLDVDRATARLKDHITRDPEAADAYVALARVHIRARRFDRALDTLELAVEVLSDPVAAAAACLLIARIRLDDLGDAAGAIEHLEQGRKLDPGNDALSELLVRAYEKAGDVQRALTAMVGVAHRKEDPSDRADALVLAANAFRARAGDVKKARRLYLEAIRHNPAHLGALTELRTMAIEAGAWEEAAQHLDRLQRHSEGNAARAKLLVELALLRRDRLNDDRAALHAFEEALALDPDNEQAGLPVAEAMLADGRAEEAGPIITRLLRATRAPESQRALLDAQGRIARALGDHALAMEAYKRAVRLGDRRREVLDALADSAIAAGAPVEALSAQKALLSTLPPSAEEDVAAALIRLGEIKLSLGDLRGASQEFERALSIDPMSRRATESVVAIAVELGAWDHVEMWEKRLLELVHEPNERRAILRRAADRWSSSPRDLRRAISALSGLLELDPTDRSVLHEILAHRKELGDFRGVANTIEFIVALDPDRARRARYLVAAAKVHRDELHDSERAMQLFDRALDDDPSALDAFRALEALITESRDLRRLERAYRKMIHRARALENPDLDFQLWHALGLIYRDRLNEPDAAVEAFRMASRVRPDDARERRIVAQLYESEGRIDLAMAELQAAIDRDPLAVEHHRALHALHRRRHDRERAYITASTLVALGAADDETRQLFESERPRGLPAYGARLLPGFSEKLLAHPELDGGVTAILAVVARAARVAKARGTTLPRGSLPPKRREDPRAPTHVASATFFQIARVLGVPMPELFLRSDLPGAFAPIAAEEPISVLGSSLLEGFGEREIAFIAAKHLASLQGAHGVRAHFPAKTELRAIFLAAISLGLGSELPATPSIAPGDLTRIARALDAALTGDERTMLRGVVASFAASTRADVNRWMQCSELTALRSALVCGGDLVTAVQVVRMDPVVAGDLSPAEKVKDLLRFAVSERHYELRRLLEIDLREPHSTTRAARSTAQAACA